MQLSSSSSIVRFATFEVDLERGELRKNGLKIRLQDQPFQVLALLLKYPGEVVTREELRDSVWPQDTFVDFDHALNTAVKKIRAALGDDADNPRFLETVPRRGYRFIAPLERETATAPEPVLISPAPPAPRAETSRTFAIIGVIAVGLVVLGLAWKVVPWHRDDANGPPEFHQLTFDIANMDSARFTPDGAAAVFSATHGLEQRELYTQRLDAQTPQSFGIPGAKLFSVSTTGELAIQRDGDANHPLPYDKRPDILARLPLGGGAPRDLMTDVVSAEWSPDGQLAVVRRVDGKSRLEFPVGKVLYETTGWVSSPRFSRRGDLIAFLVHPVIPDDRGSVAVVDLNGKKKRMISRFWESTHGLAWSPSGDEVWFAATRSGVGRALYAASLSGQERRILSIAGGLSLQDVFSDGRVLLTQDNEQVRISFLGPDQKAGRELSWLDFSLAADISPDSKKVLFGSEGVNSGPSYQVGLRPTDGSPPVMLGEGIAQSLSPDGQWALSIVPPPNDQILLLPTGAGTQRGLNRGPISHYQFMRAGWFPDGKHVYFVASEANHGERCYIQDLDGGLPRAMTPDGIAFCSVAPDGHVLAVTNDAIGLLYSSASSASPQREIQLNHGDIPIAWTNDSKYVYLLDKSRTTILRFELASGQRRFWKELPLPAPNAEMKDFAIGITPDGKSVAYTYSLCHTDLYLVKGLK
ncbi:MAG TPA: winged helix-turn-helix domain-containing protein [Terriglobales bacterium]